MSRHARLLFLQSALRPRHWRLATLASCFFSQHSGPDTGVSPRSPPISSVSTQAPTLVSRHARLLFLQSALRPDAGVSPRSPPVSSVSTQAPTLESRHARLLFLQAALRPQHWCLAMLSSPASPTFSLHSGHATGHSPSAGYHILPPTTAMADYATSHTTVS